MKEIPPNPNYVAITRRDMEDKLKKRGEHERFTEKVTKILKYGKFKDFIEQHIDNYSGHERERELHDLWLIVYESKEDYRKKVARDLYFNDEHFIEFGEEGLLEDQKSKIDDFILVHFDIAQQTIQKYFVK